MGRRVFGPSLRRAGTRRSSCPSLVDRYRSEHRAGRHHGALLVGLFALDFLTIHPFADGNGRLSRLLSTRLLSEVGYGVSRYVSLEGLVYERRDAYYGALAASTAGWQDGTHDPWPWLRFFVEVIADAYETFAERAADDRSGITRQDRVRNYVLEHAGAFFEVAGTEVKVDFLSPPSWADRAGAAVHQRSTRTGHLIPGALESRSSAVRSSQSSASASATYAAS